MKIMATSFKMSHVCVLLHSVLPTLQQATSPLPETPGHSQASLGQSLVGSLLLSPGSWYIQGSCVPYFPALCKFWQLCGGVNGHLLQEGFCHTQVCYTQSPCLCGSPLLTHTSTRDIQTQFCLSICEVSESWCAQCFFKPPEPLSHHFIANRGEKWKQ